MEIIASLIIVAFLAGYASMLRSQRNAYRDFSTVMYKQAARAERRSRREKRRLEIKIELLTDKLLIKSGVGPLIPPSFDPTSEDRPPKSRIVSPSEAIARQQKADAEAIPAGVRNAFMAKASEIHASAGNAASRNGSSGE